MPPKAGRSSGGGSSPSGGSVFEGMDPTSAGAEETQALTRRAAPPGTTSDSSAVESEDYTHYYRKHGGKMRFCCGGRCMAGPSIDNEYVLFACLAIFVPSGIYFVWAAPLLLEHWGPRLPLSAAAALVATLVSMCATTFTDPGFIMKNGQPAPRNPPTDWSQPPVYKHIKTEIGTYPFAWCITCKIWRPPYAHHCPDCDHCVLGFDHHCPFVNNCIGVRNHFYFVAFISSVCGLGVVVLIGTGSAMYIKSELQKGELADVALSEDKQMVILICMALPVTMLTIILIVFVFFHTVYLPCCGPTGYMKDGLFSCLKQACCCCGDGPVTEVEAGAAAGTKAFCKRNKPKKPVELSSPTPSDGGATPPAARSAGGYAPVGGVAATPMRHANHPMKIQAVGKELHALDGGKLSGVHGWEMSDGKATKLCMERLMKPRRVVRTSSGLAGHDSAV